MTYSSTNGSTNGHSTTTTIRTDPEDRIKELIDDPGLIATITQIAAQQRREFLPQVLCLIEKGIEAHPDTTTFPKVSSRSQP